MGRTALISVWTLASRILGYVREMISAALFGDSSAVFDAFITAWRVPNLFRRFLGEGALSTSFQTALTEADGDHGEDAGRRLFGRTLLALLALAGGVCAVVMAGVSLMPDRMPGTGWAWLGSDPGYVRELTLRVMPFVVLVCVSALAGGALQVRGSFAAPAFAPVALNAVWILVLVAIWFGGEGSGPDPARDLERARWLAWGVLLAGAAQLAVQLPALRRTGFIGEGGVSSSRVPDEPGAGLVLRRALPLAFGAAVYQINVMVDGLMAEGLLPDGGPTLHYFANRVQQFPMALIAIAATSAVFPALQAHGHRKDLRAVRDLHDRTHRAICFVALPASAGLLALAGPIVEVSFGRGAFGVEGVTRTSAALAALAVALVPAGAVGLVARTYYALGDFRTPVRVSAWMLVVNALLNLGFVRLLHLDVDGLAWATVTTSWLSLLLLWPRSSSKLELPPREVELGPSLVRMLLASGGVYLAARLCWLSLSSTGEVLALLLSIGAGVLAYVASARVLGVEELQPLLRRLSRNR